MAGGYSERYSVKYAEILDSVNKAFTHQMLIVGFNETRHNKKYTADENFFEFNNDGADKLVACLNKAVEDEVFFEAGLTAQKNAAMMDNDENYRNLIYSIIEYLEK